MSKSLPFQNRITEHYASLSPNARRIADYLQQNPMEVLSASVAEIAGITNTSKATVSRFFRQLGYESHLDAKTELKSLRNFGLPLGGKPIQEDFVEQEIQLLRKTWSQLSQSEIETIATKIVSANKVVLIGFRNSFPIAQIMRQQLQQIRENILLLPLPGQSLSEDLSSIGANDLVILVGFRRRPHIFAQLVKQLSRVPTLLLTDTTGQTYVDQVDELIVCDLGQQQALDSYAAPLSVVSVLCHHVYHQLGDKAKRRALAISDMYWDLGELEQR